MCRQCTPAAHATPVGPRPAPCTRATLYWVQGAPQHARPANPCLTALHREAENNIHNICTKQQSITNSQKKKIVGLAAETSALCTPSTAQLRSSMPGPQRAPCTPLTLASNPLGAPEDRGVLQRIVQGGCGGRGGAIAAADDAAAGRSAGRQSRAAALHARNAVQHAHRVDEVQVYIPAETRKPLTTCALHSQGVRRAAQAPKNRPVQWHSMPATRTTCPQSQQVQV